MRHRTKDKSREVTFEINLKRAERLRQSILRSAFTGKLIDISSTHSQGSPPLINDVKRGKNKSDA